MQQSRLYKVQNNIMLRFLYFVYYFDSALKQWKMLLYNKLNVVTSSKQKIKLILWFLINFENECDISA